MTNNRLFGKDEYLSLEEVEKYLDHGVAWCQLADTMRENEVLKSQWMPILGFLQDNPDVIGAKVGHSISKRLLEWLQRNKDSTS